MDRLTVRIPGELRQRLRGLAADFRRRHHLDEPNAQIQLVEHDDGHTEIVPMIAVPADQAWFWSREWQEMEREADTDVAAGRVTLVDGVDELVAHLDS